MAIGTLGTKSTTGLAAVTFNPAQPVGQASASSTLSPADLGSLVDMMVSDLFFAASNPTGVLATGTTHSSTTLDTLVSTGGGPLSSIQIGALVIGVNAATGALVIPAGTFVIAKPTATSVTLSAAATNSAASMRIGFINPSQDILSTRLNFEGILDIPRRGQLKVFPGDVVAVDSTGWPVLVSAAAIAYAGTSWNKV